MGSGVQEIGKICFQSIEMSENGSLMVENWELILDKLFSPCGHFSSP